MRMLLLVCSACLLWSGSVQAAVIETNEWSNKTQAGWVYVNSTFNTPPFIDSTTPSPSGDGAITFTYPAGSGTASFGPGVAVYDSLALGEMYTGFWFRLSPGFVFHPIGTKILYQKGSLISPNIGQLPYMASYIHADRKIRISIGNMGNGAFASLPHDLLQNKSQNIIQPGIWYWVEYHVKKNTPLQQDGVFELWLNNVLTHQYFNVLYFDIADNWKMVRHSPEYGGGGNWSIPSTQYMYVDHTVVSTTKIGIPGGGADTTAPTTPAGLTVSWLLEQAASAWNALSGWFLPSEAAAAEIQPDHLTDPTTAASVHCPAGAARLPTAADPVP